MDPWLVTTYWGSGELLKEGHDLDKGTGVCLCVGRGVCVCVCVELGYATIFVNGMLMNMTNHINGPPL